MHAVLVTTRRSCTAVQMMGHVALLLLGVFCASTSVIFIKLSGTDPTWLSCYRLLLASLLLLPVYRMALPGSGWSQRELWKRGVVPGAMLAAHFILWIAGARLTNSAHATLIVNMAPIVMPFALMLLVREKVTRTEHLGTAIAICGMFVLAAGDVQLDPAYFRGDILCFVSMLFYALYLALGRRNRDLPSIWLYVVPTYTVAGLCCGFVGLVQWSFDPAGNPAAGPWGALDWLGIIGLALIPTICGHSLINQALRHIRGQLVVLINLSQFIFAAALAWLLLGEAPKPLFYPSALLVVVGALLVILTTPRERRPAGKQAPESAAH